MSLSLSVPSSFETSGTVFRGVTVYVFVVHFYHDISAVGFSMNKTMTSLTFTFFLIINGSIKEKNKIF